MLNSLSIICTISFFWLLTSSHSLKPILYMINGFHHYTNIDHYSVRTCSFVSNSLRFHGLQSTRILCPWDFPGKNTGVGCHFLLQGIFPTQGYNSCLLHCRQILYTGPMELCLYWNLYWNYASILSQSEVEPNSYWERKLLESSVTYSWS